MSNSLIIINNWKYQHQKFANECIQGKYLLSLDDIAAVCAWNAILWKFLIRQSHPSREAKSTTTEGKNLFIHRLSSPSLYSYTRAALLYAHLSKVLIISFVSGRKFCSMKKLCELFFLEISQRCKYDEVYTKQKLSHVEICGNFTDHLRQSKNMMLIGCDVKKKEEMNGQARPLPWSSSHHIAFFSCMRSLCAHLRPGDSDLAQKRNESRTEKKTSKLVFLLFSSRFNLVRTRFSLWNEIELRVNKQIYTFFFEVSRRSPKKRV